MRIWNLKKLGLILLLVCLGRLVQANEAPETNFIFIDPVDAQKVWRVKIPLVEEILISAEQLPQQHPEHEAVYFADQKFSYMALSPDQKRLAFSVDAVAHDWVGILELKSKQIQDMDFFLEGKSLMPVWSQDGRFLVVEGEIPEQKFVEIFDTQQQTNCRIEAKGLQKRFLNFSHAWFAQGNEVLFFRVDYNNDYRKRLGLKKKPIPSRIGQTDLQCQNLALYSFKEFLSRFPEQVNSEQARAVGFNQENQGTELGAIP